MKNDLERISDMGFNFVYINPIHLVSEQYVTRKSEGEEQKVKGRFYSIRNYKKNTLESINPIFFSKFSSINDEIEQYTFRAHEPNISPIFYLVLKHVAVDYFGIYSSNDPIISDWIEEKLGDVDDVCDFKYSYQFDTGTITDFSKEYGSGFIEQYRQNALTNFWVIVQPQAVDYETKKALN